MRSVRTDLAKNYSNLLGNKGIPQKNHYHFQKWLRYYLDFCHKYQFIPADKDSLPDFEDLGLCFAEHAYRSCRYLRLRPRRRHTDAAPGWYLSVCESGCQCTPAMGNLHRWYRIFKQKKGQNVSCWDRGQISTPTAHLYCPKWPSRRAFKYGYALLSLLISWYKKPLV